jgi:GT2 family glycosyltransferase
MCQESDNRMSDKILSIVIPVWNKSNFTKSCLQDLSKLTNDHEIVIVDNNSTDDTAEIITKMADSTPDLKAKLIYHKNDENLGFAKACNIGYGLSTASNILFLNNDIRVKSNYSDWTKPLLEQCSNSLVGPTMGQLDNDLNFVQEANKLLPGNSYMSGWCLASSREIWSKLWIPRNETRCVPLAPQIFSEEFGLAYFEDTDLSFRARKMNIPFKVIQVPVVHFGKQTSKQLNVHQLYKQARQIFVKKWGK